jgi:ATP-dependent Lon protease
LGQIGVAVGLAWTSVGGEVMVVEASKMPGDGQLVLTGQLGSVMKESATIALNWIRSHARQVKSEKNGLEFNVKVKLLRIMGGNSQNFLRQIRFL